jgi:hypothetical protein
MTNMKDSVTRALLGGGLLAWLLSVTPTSSYTGPRFPQSTVLSGVDIEEAVVRGQNGEVLPYVINRPIGGGSSPRAVIYTPFVRVALAAMARVLTFDGSRVLSQVASQWIASPEVLVVIGSPCPGEPACEFGGDAVDPIAVNPTRLYIRHQASPPGSSVPAAVAIPIRVLPIRDLQWLGTIPVKEPVVAATFNPQDFRPGSHVVAEWGRWDRVVFSAGGQIQGSELDTWR